MRAAWRVMVARSVAPERLIFVDECGTHTSMAPLYGYAPEGERLRLRVPRGRGKNTTVLSSMTIEGMGPTLAVEGATTARVFQTYVEKEGYYEVEVTKADGTQVDVHLDKNFNVLNAQSNGGGTDTQNGPNDSNDSNDSSGG